MTTSDLAAASAGDTIKNRVRATINERRKTFINLAHDIHQRPELAFSETYAADRITSVLSQEGFTVLRGVGGLPTAFTATIGDGPLHVAFCAEYDALDEGIGHGCGHNLIAGAAVAAAVGLKESTAELGMTVSVIGTPGEELLGLKDPPSGHTVSGKIVLLEAGVFNRIHAVLMLHPGASPYGEFIPSHASMRLRAQFSKGRPGIDATAALKLEKAVSRTLARMRHAPYFCRVAPQGQQDGAQADMFIAAPSLVELIKVVEPVRRTGRMPSFVRTGNWRPRSAGTPRRSGRSARPKRTSRPNFDTSEQNSSGVRCMIHVKSYRWSRWCGTRRSDCSLISRR